MLPHVHDGHNRIHAFILHLRFTIAVLEVCTVHIAAQYTVLHGVAFFSWLEETMQQIVSAQW